MLAIDESLRNAQDSLRRGHLARAERFCAEVLRADDAHPEALHVLGIVALQRGRSTEAIRHLTRALERKPSHAVVRLNLATAQQATGDAAGALLQANAALALRPCYAEALNARGNALLALQRPAEALESYEQAIRLRADLTPLHVNRGHALRDLGRREDALAGYQRALALHGQLGPALVGAGEMLRALGRPTEARTLCERCLSSDPDAVEALRLRAGLASDAGEHGEALRDLERALRREPEVPDLLLERGNALFKLQRFDEALEDFERVVALDARHIPGWLNRGRALLRLHRPEDSLASFERALALDPGQSQAHVGRARALRRLLRVAEAIDCYERALRIDPRAVQSRIGLGHCFLDQRQLPRALSEYQAAATLDPGNLAALTGCAFALMGLERLEEAADCLERLLASDPERGPEHESALGRLHYVRLLACDWRDFDRRASAISAGIMAGRGVSIPPLYVCTGDSPEEHWRCARRFIAERWGPIVQADWNGPRYRHDRVRIAYVSPDFGDHPVSQLLTALLEAHDRTRFEVTAVSLLRREECEFKSRVAHACERYLDASEVRAEEVAQTLRALEIDIAVDLCGFHADSRPAIFARRAAPIQVNFLGYAGTLAGAYMDYALVDGVVVPEEDERFYSERLVRLPHSYLPPGDRPPEDLPAPPRSDHGLPEGRFVFCNFNAPWKLNPELFGIWMRLLAAVEGSVLWLPMREPVASRLRGEAARRGIDPARLLFASRLPELDRHIARLRCADLFLDTLPYNAHATAMHALWAGLPVLTCRGRSLAGRVGASLCGGLGLPELVAEDLEDYERRALRLAREPQVLQGIRAHLTALRGTHPLFDSRRFCRDLEAAYSEMTRLFGQGLPPQAFRICDGTPVGGAPSGSAR